MEHVLVTGGAGYIGSACVEYLLDRGYKVTVFDALLTGHRDAVDPRAEFVRGHLADREGIINLCRERHFAHTNIYTHSFRPYLPPSAQYNVTLVIIVGA